MSSQKTIKITPSFFSYSSNSKGSKGKGTRKLKPNIPNKVNLSSSKLKRNFINRIKELKKQRQQQNEELSSRTTYNTNEDSSDDFASSLNFVKNIITGEKQKDEIKNKIKNPTIHNSSLHGPIIDFSRNSHNQNTNTNSISIPNTKPNIFEPKIMKSPIPNVRETVMPENHFVDNTNNNSHSLHDEKTLKPKIINKTFKIEDKKQGKKIKLGKIKNRVSVLVRNQTLKKKTDNYITRLKSDDLKKIKEYLSSNGFIKYGSNAPEALLREMYINIKTGAKLRNMKMDNYISKVTNIE